MESVKGNIEPVRVTRNKLLKVNCKPVEAILIPLLEKVFGEACECVAAEVVADLQAFLKLIAANLAEMNNRPKSIEEFSRYAHKVSIYCLDFFAFTFFLMN
jgi:hypothetical protein